MIRSPAASTLPAGASPSPNSAILPSAVATQPRSITRSASTTRALPMMVSVVVISRLPSCGGSKRCHVDDAVGDQVAYFVVMDDGDHRHALTFLLGDQLDHDGAVGGVQRGGRFV